MKRPYCDESPNDPNCIIRDGQGVRVQITAMDAARCTCPPVVDTQRMLADVERLKALDKQAATLSLYVGRFDAERDHREHQAATDGTGRDGYAKRIKDAWRAPALIGGGV